MCYDGISCGSALIPGSICEGACTDKDIDDSTGCIYYTGYCESYTINGESGCDGITGCTWQPTA